MKRILTVILAGIVPFAMFAADTLDGIFNSRFKSLTTTVAGNEMSPPVITLNGNDRVIISFDELSDERSYLRYSLVHCNALWQPSGLVESEFLDGFNIGDVEEFSYSQATTVNYIHYSLSLPNDRMRFTISGNYLLKVFPENNPPVSKELFNWTDTYTIEVADPGDALAALMLVLAIDAEKCSEK